MLLSNIDQLLRAYERRESLQAHKLFALCSLLHQLHPSSAEPIKRRTTTRSGKRVSLPYTVEEKKSLVTNALPLSFDMSAAMKAYIDSEIEDPTMKAAQTEIHAWVFKCKRELGVPLSKQIQSEQFTVAYILHLNDE